MQNHRGFVPKHGGYRNLKSFQNAEIVYDFTVEFCKIHVDRTYGANRSYSGRMTDQMVQAARSGVQNIVEGSQASGHSKMTELTLMGVARASLEELLRDYKDFLRQRGLEEWGKEDRRARDVRGLAYRLNRSYTTYRTYIENPEVAANVALCLIFQTTYLLDQQIQALEKELLREGDVKEQFRSRRVEERKRMLMGGGPPIDEFLAGLGFEVLPNGQVRKVDKKM